MEPYAMRVLLFLTTKGVQVKVRSPLDPNKNECLPVTPMELNWRKRQKRRKQGFVKANHLFKMSSLGNDVTLLDCVMLTLYLVFCSTHGSRLKGLLSIASYEQFNYYYCCYYCYYYWLLGLLLKLYIALNDEFTSLTSVGSWKKD